MIDRQIIKELADRLVLLGLKRGDCEVNNDDSDEQYALIAKWKIGQRSNVEVYCYLGNYFGSPHVWVGFGSPKADDMTNIMTGICEDTYAVIESRDWGDDLEIIKKPKMAELKRKSFLSYENYTANPRMWAWFGQYYPLGSDVVKKALPMLRLVVQLAKSRQPAATDAEVHKTEAVRLMRARIGQDRFREAVIRRWGGICVVTGCEIVPALEAAHIRPWFSSGDVSLRMSADNGLLLSRTLHALFDLGLISFSNDGRMKISRYVNSEERKRLGIKEGQKLLGRTLSAQQKKNMAYHREASLVDA